jgi:hypothetical protein
MDHGGGEAENKPMTTETSRSQQWKSNASPWLIAAMVVLSRLYRLEKLLSALHHQLQRCEFSLPKNALLLMPLSPEKRPGDCVLAKQEAVWVSNRFHKQERPARIYTLAEKTLASSDRSGG